MPQQAKLDEAGADASDDAKEALATATEEREVAETARLEAEGEK